MQYTRVQKGNWKSPIVEALQIKSTVESLCYVAQLNFNHLIHTP